MRSSTSQALSRLGALNKGRAVVVASVLVAAGLQAVPSLHLQASADSSARTAPDVSSADNTASAFAAARAEGHRVEDTSQRDASTSVFINPDGSSTAELSSAPRNVQQSDGSWTPIDPTLKLGSDGRLHARNLPYDVSLSNGGDASAVDVKSGKGRRAKFGLAKSGQLATPAVSGNTATYPEVMPGVDAQLSLTPSGFEVTYIVKKRPSNGKIQLRLPLDLTGLKTGKNKHGDPDLTDDAGTAVVDGAPAMMFDAGTDPGKATPDALRPVTQSVDSTGITLDPDASFLADPATQYPVKIDPFYGLSFHYGSYVYEAGPGTNYDASGYFRTGLATTTSTTRQRTLLRFLIPTSLTGKHILDASLGLYLYSATSCSAQTVVRTASAAWSASTVTWSNQPAFSGPYDATGFAAGCTGKTQTIHMTDVANLWINSGVANNGFVLTGSPETDSATNKIWYSENANGGAQTPTLSITYNSYPTTVAARATAPSAVNGSTTYVGSTTPILTGGSTDLDGGQDQVAFEVHNASTNALVASGRSPMAPQGTIGHWTVNTPLTTGLSYYWRALGFDGTDYSQAYSSNITFTVDTTPPPAPTVTSSTYPPNVWTAAGPPGSFSFSSVDAGVGVDHYVYGLDTGSTATTPSSSSLTLNPMPDGWHTLYVQAVDKLGNVSSGTTYQFGSSPGMSSPAEGQKTPQYLTLAAQAPPTSSTDITFNYRLTAAAGWTQVPPGDVTLGGTGIGQWPVQGSVSTVPGSGTPGAADVATPDNLVWNVAHTLGDQDGGVQLQVCFGSSCSLRVRNFSLDEHAFGDSYASTAFGPGDLNLLTGNLSISETDVSAPAYGSSLTLGRTFNSLDPNKASALGKGWQLSLPADSGNSDWTNLSDTGAGLTLTAADGSTTSYAKTASGNYAATGDDSGDGTTVTAGTAGTNGPASYTLTDLDGSKATFTPTTTLTSPPTITSPNSYTMYSVSSPAATGTDPTITYGSSGGLTRLMLAPAPPGGSCTYHYDSSGNTAWDTFTVGCRALELGYVSGQITTVTLDVNTGSGLTQIDTACYSYDSNGRLIQAWDPRDGTAGTGTHPVTCGTPVLAVSYGYDDAGRITSVTPPGEAPYVLSYTSGRATSVTRTHSGGGSETSTVQYGVSLSPDGTHPEYRPSMSGSDVATWAQTDQPVTAVAVFGPGDHVDANDLRGADVHYLDVNGREVNTASYSGTGSGGWHISTTEYDTTGNTIRTLSANNREEALNPSGPAGEALGLPSDTAQAALALSNVQQYTTSAADGVQDLADSYGPYHLVALGTAGTASGDDISEVGARLHTHYTYDDGTELGHARQPGPLHLVTAVTTTASQGPLATATNEVDARTTTSAYALSASESGTGVEDDTGWVLRSPMKTVTDSTGIATATVIRYDATTSEPIESRMPRAGTTGGDAATSDTIYYTAGTNTADSACGNHPEWANMACKTRPAAQPGTAGLPDLPVTWTSSYDYLDRPLVVQQTVGSTTRTTTNSYLNSGWGTRDLSTSVTGGVGAAVPTSTTSYDPNTGRPTVVSASKTDENPATSSTTSYDDFGRVIGYTENDQAIGLAANHVTTAYGANGQVASVQDAHSTLTYSYNGGSDYRDLVTSMRVQVAGSTPYDATYTVSYDSNGSPAWQDDPNGIHTVLTRDENNQLLGLAATKAGNPWLTDHATPNIYGEWLGENNDAGDHHYSYDTLGRLTAADNTPNGATGCTSRTYTFDKNSNRTSMTAYGPAADNSCQTTSGGSTTGHNYDLADRLTDAGVNYDAYGRITSLPAADTSNNVALTSGYYANDLLRTQAQTTAQGSTSMCWTLDPTQRPREASTYPTSDCTGTATKDTTNHYDDADSDSPDWIAENIDQSNWTANVDDLIGGLGVTVDQTGTPTYSYTNLHGDTLATAAAGAASPAVSTDYDEYGNPTDHKIRRYGWLGEKQRSGDDLGGNLLMGVRVYNPLLGRFLSTDPEPGGSANVYDYSGQDPVNNTDLDGRNYASDAGDAATAAQAEWQQNYLKHEHHKHKKKHHHHWWSKAKHWVSHHKLDIALTAAAFIPGVGEAALAEEAELIAAREIEEEAANVAERCVNSFTSGTPVLMADGTSKPISKVALGDLVLAIDVSSGALEPKPVTLLIRHSGLHAMVAITLSDGTTILATAGHLFWAVTSNSFRRAEDLSAGDVLQTPQGTIGISAVRDFRANLQAFNLEVADDHTYFAGTRPVVVHNSCNIMNKEIATRKAPKGIKRVDKGNPDIPGNQDHVHFHGSRATLNRDGSWGHGGTGSLSSSQRAWLRGWGWNV